MTPEGKITAAIVRRLKQLRAEGVAVEWLKIAGSPMQRAGWPDLLVVVRGTTLYVEIKSPAGRLSKLQAEQIKRLRAAGAMVAIVRSVEEFSGVLECL